jgi:hypothetical protein
VPAQGVQRDVSLPPLGVAALTGSGPYARRFFRFKGTQMEEVIQPAQKQERPGVTGGLVRGVVFALPLVASFWALVAAAVWAVSR